jgi:hypothetical protein
MAEVTPWMSLGAATNEPGMLCWQDIVYTEVCDPVSLTRVPYGCEGTPVYTTLERTSQPMIRLVSGDLTRWEAPSTDRGRTYPFLPHGVYGRIDDMFVVRGENIYPKLLRARIANHHCDSERPGAHGQEPDVRARPPGSSKRSAICRTVRAVAISRRLELVGVATLHGSPWRPVTARRR